MLCCGSKKWRWLILWTSKNPRDQFMEWIFQTSRCQTRKLPVLWTRSSRIPSSRRRSASKSRKPKKRTGFFSENRSPSWSTTTFEWLALMIQYKIMLMCSLLLFVIIIFRNSIQDGTKFYYRFESLYKLRIRESDQLKTVLELYDMKIHQKTLVPNYQKLKTMVKRSFDQKLRLRNFDARHGKLESGAVVESRKGLIGVEGGKGICYQ